MKKPKHYTIKNLVKEFAEAMAEGGEKRYEEECQDRFDELAKKETLRIMDEVIPIIEQFNWNVPLAGLALNLETYTETLNELQCHVFYALLLEKAKQVPTPELSEAEKIQRLVNALDRTNRYDKIISRNVLRSIAAELETKEIARGFGFDAHPDPRSDF